MGAAISSEIPTRYNVPSNADQMPPLRMPPVGLVVRNSHDSRGKASLTRYPTITISGTTIETDMAPRMILAASSWRCFFRTSGVSANMDMGKRPTLLLANALDHEVGGQIHREG